MHRPIGLAAAAGLLALLACGSSTTTTPATPTPTMPTPVTVASIAISGNAPVTGATSQFSAIATMSNGTTQDVTSQAAWQSSVPAIATVSPTGAVQGLLAGDVQLTVGFQLVFANRTITIAVSPQRFTVSGRVTDATDGRPVHDVNVATVDPRTELLATATSEAGTYSIGGVAPGTVAVTAAGRGYRTATQNITLTGDATVNFLIQRATVPAAR